MNASDFSFGIEIETHVKQTIAVGGYHHGAPVPARLDTTAGAWRAERDASIRYPAGRQACEFVSPILKGSAGVAEVVAFVKWIKSEANISAEVNGSCGVHVTVGFPTSDGKAVDRLVHLVANFEQALYASTGTKNRENGNYCRSIRRLESSQRVTEQAAVNRYFGLNLQNQHSGRVEFRFFAGTLNVTKLVGHILTVLGLCEKAVNAKRVTRWTAKETSATSPVYRKSGAGATALTRLFLTLGWTKGRSKRVYGDVSTPSGPTLEQCKKTLLKMAKKYDDAS